MKGRSSKGTTQGVGPPTFELHTLGWRSFQDLCAAVLREVWGQSVQPFADSRDAGRDGAFYGIWSGTSGSADVPDGPVVIQCKFLSRRDKTLSLSGVDEELAKVEHLVSQGLCHSYVLMTNARVTGNSEQAIRQAIAERGVRFPLVLGGQWLNQTIAGSQRLRMFVPRVYGLGDLSQVLDERAYGQARALLEYLQEDLSTFVVTDAYRRAAQAIDEHGFCLLLGEPAVGKSVIAATLAITALDHWGSLVIRADSPEDVVTHWNPNEPKQFFWIDDAFGSLRHDRALTDSWARRLPKVMAAVKGGGARIVLTSRDYIYRDARPLLKEYAYPLLRERQVVIDVAELTQLERRQILYSHIRLGDQPKAFRTKLKPHLDAAADQVPFRPEVARRLGRQAFTKNLTISRAELEHFMARPNGFLQEVYEGLEADHVGALAILYQSGELPVPLGPTTSERQELLALVGSAPNKVARTLTVLEGTFLRRSPKPGAVDNQEFWSFRHPTLREGFATFIAANPNLVKVLIAGLEDQELLNQLDCGAGEMRGTLISVPPSLFRMVADRVAMARPSRGLQWQKYWLRQRRWANFLASRCSRNFLETYLAVDPQLIERCLSIGSYLSADDGLPVLAKLHLFGLLPEELRLKALATVSDLAIETPDDGWLHNETVQTLFTTEERAAILERVRTELVPNLDDELYSWYGNEQGDSAEEYYRPLEDALRVYAQALKNDRTSYAALQEALNTVDRWRIEADYWRDDEGNLPESPPSRSSAAPWRRPVTASDVGGRSIFDDVDE